jgi:NlpC/P60 family putative phage cell wall peptidase
MHPAGFSATRRQPDFGNTEWAVKMVSGTDRWLDRVAIVAEARSWLGTPYRHQASLKGAGCDCFGLVRGVWRAFHGAEPEPVPPYSRDWGSVTGKEALMDTARRHLVEVDPAKMGPGDVVVFRMRRGTVAKHAGIVTEAGVGCQVSGVKVGSADGASAQSGDEPPGLRSAPSGLRRKREVATAIRFIHAQEHLPVSEVALSDWWRRRIVSAFGFPGVGNDTGPLIPGPTRDHW